MSIRTFIGSWVSDGRLAYLEPSVPGDPQERTLVISNEIKELIDGPWPDKSWALRCGRLRADLEDFVVGRRLGVCLQPFAAGAAYMARLRHPDDEVWDIRSRDPSPALRVFGRFAERDVFVALLWSPRSTEIPWSNKPPLGDWKSREWRDARVGCKAEWNKLFPAYAPIHGDAVHDYISQKVFHV